MLFLGGKSLVSGPFRESVRGLAGSNPRLMAAADHAARAASRGIRADTLKHYIGPLRWYADFVSQTGLLPRGQPLFPLDTAVLHLFLADLSRQKQNKSSTANAISALRWFSVFLGESTEALDAAPNRKLAAGDAWVHPSTRKVSCALTPDMFSALMAFAPRTTVERRSRFGWVLLFYCGMRLASVLRLRRIDFVFNTSVLRVCIQDHKTQDRSREGFFSVLARLPPGTMGVCPAQECESFFREVGIWEPLNPLNAACRVIRPLQKQRGGKRGHATLQDNSDISKVTAGVSESTIRKQLRAYAKAAGVEVPDIWLTPKSGRSGCISALAGAGMDRKERERHVHWASARSADLYTSFSEESQAAPSRTLANLVARGPAPQQTQATSAAASRTSQGAEELFRAPEGR